MDNGSNPFKNWQELQKSLIQHLPLANGYDSNEIDQFVRKTLKNFMQGAAPDPSPHNPFWTEEHLEYDLFESQRTIFVRCKITDKTNINKMRMFLSNKKLKIEHSESTQEIKLPSDVNPSRAFARMDGDVMEIRLPKTRESEIFREIYIRE